MNQTASAREYELEIRIAAPREVVWDAIASDEELRRWFPPAARVESGVGGEVVWQWDDAHTWSQRIEVWEPGKRLRTRYDSQVEDDAGRPRPLFIDFYLDGDGGTTRLRVVQSGFGPEAGFDAEYDGISRGWPVELGSLRLYLERHRGRDRGLAWSRCPVHLVHEEGWRRLTDALGCARRPDALRPGEAFTMRLADGHEVAGEALYCNPFQFSGVATSHGSGFFRATVERCGRPDLEAWLWLATYGRPDEEVARVQRDFDRLLARVFPAEHGGGGGAG